MKVGISLTSSHAVADPREGARWMIERAAAARRAGLDSLFVGDHHATPGPYYQNVPVLGRLLAEWGEAPAGCLFLLPLWNPLLIAEQVGTLAALMRGRFIFQCGLGDDPRQFAAMGADIRFRPSAFEEAFGLIQRLLRGETVSASGRFRFENARVLLRPAEPVEYWIGASADVAIDRAARIADGFLASPGQVPERARAQAELYLERCAKHGRTPTAVAVRRDIYVGATAAEADEVAGAIARKGYRGFDPAALIWGSVEQVVEKFRALGAMGYTDVIVRHLTDDHTRVLGSLERLAAVRAALRDA
jgi:alkanesulfonate monooxygenase SsuD/methylene tetrahydromethanopterin reductase-like flavin-dependent oxidoreductase (luciferase family)